MSKNKKEIINNLNNFSQINNLNFNPEFRHFKTNYYDTEAKLQIMKYQNNWVAYNKVFKTSYCKTRKEAVDACLNDKETGYNR